MSETFEGATVEAALETASAKMGVAASDLEHEVLEEKADFWGTGGSTVVIKVWEREQIPAATEIEEETVPALETRERTAETHEPVTAELPVEAPAAASAGPAPSSEQDVAGPEAGVTEQVSSEPVGDEATSPTGETPESADVEDVSDVPTVSAAAPEAVAALATSEGAPAAEADHAPESSSVDGQGVEPAAISGMLEQIFHDMEFDCTVTVEPEDDGFLATIDGADKDALLEGNGRCLSALELLINNAFRHKLPRGNKVRVDAGDFRNRRDEELSDLAFQVAHSAKESGRTQETQPLNPYERRLVHLALAEDPAVTTRSRGSGFLKNVQVIPRGAGGGRARRG